MSKVVVTKYQESHSALDVCLHPLVVINISDHFTRSKLNKSKTGVYGIIIGTQVGRKIELRTSFEVVVTVGSKQEINIIERFYNERSKQYLTVFENYEILGWYRVGEKVEKTDEQFHQLIVRMTGNDNPVFLLCGAEFGLEVKQLPVHVFESVVEGVNEQGDEKSHWAYLPYKIETEISEQISLDHISRNVASGASTSQVHGTFSKYANAMTMLQQRLKVVVRYLEQIKAGKAKPDHDMLRRCAYLASRLPAVDSDKFNNDYVNELNEVLMISYLSTMTKTTNEFNDLIEKYNTTYESKRRMPRGMGRFARHDFF